jgi:hypothetical protein
MINSIFKSLSFLFFSILLLQVISCQKKEDALPVSQETYLTSDASKSWRIIANTRDTVKGLSPSCKTSSIQNTDNKFTFAKGGAFQYSNGTITNDASCQASGCCSDLANLTGNWIVRNDSLVVKVNARIDNGQTTPVKELELLKGRITKLDENQLILSNVYVVTFNRIP